MTMLGALLTLLGCDRTGELRPGVTTAAEVRQKMGVPTMEWREGSDRIWEYPFTPAGPRTYMLTIGPDDVLKAMEQVLTPENFAKVVPGMTREAVRRLLGKPAAVTVLDQRGQEVWDWPAETPYLNTDAHFSAHFSLADGRVVTTSRIEQSRG